MENYLIEVHIPASSLHEALEKIHVIHKVLYVVKIEGANDKSGKGKTCQCRTR